MAVDTQGTEVSVPYYQTITGYIPYPWQERLYRLFLAGETPPAVDIPTGLGKTSTVLLYLLAQGHGGNLPRRLVYVVDRRAIVDQTVVSIRAWVDRLRGIPALAERFDTLAAFPAPSPVSLGVLRGGFADDGAWRTDPARPTVVVGTVDMIGSRLLFRGYGDGLSRRPLHAGLLGRDTTLALDEAHLSPAMSGLIRDIQALQVDGERPAFKTMTLSATPAEGMTVFGLDADDEVHDAVGQRLNAVKRLKLHGVKSDALRIDSIVEFACKFRTGSVLVFVRSVADASQVASKLMTRLGKGQAHRVGLLTGTLRGKEREQLTQTDLWSSFSPDRERNSFEPSRYLISTSAGEVGVDLDADHAVMDLTTLDSMIQRLGRVNRTGAGTATVHVIHTNKEKEDPKQPKKITHRYRLDRALYCSYCHLRRLRTVSPIDLRDIEPVERREASAPAANAVPLRAQTVEILAATTAAIGTPPLELFLRGLSDAPEVPETHIIWRWDVPHLVSCGDAAAAEALSLFRPDPGELARVPTPRALELVEAAIGRGTPLPVVVRDSNGVVSTYSLAAESELPNLDYGTLFLPTIAGGLLTGGLPDPDAIDEVTDVADTDERLRYIKGEEADEPLPSWASQAIELRFPLHDVYDDDAEPRWLIYAVRRFDPSVQDSDSDVTRLAAAPQILSDHGDRVAAAARRIGEALDLPPDIVEALERAGHWHDHGKERRVWQRAAGIPASGPPLAKSRTGSFRPSLLGGFRHEFGSLTDAERALPPTSALDLTLHLIAAHHGRARPGFPDARHWDPDLPADMCADVAHRVAQRFGRLQGELGPWRLAWLEALLKAADAWVSTNKDISGGDVG